MSYLVTARKWRPSLFGDVVGQSHVTATLQNAIRADRVGHAYLFSGPRGVGKTTVARIFAKALNCVRGPAEEPCNECEHCLAIGAGSSMDVQELDGASNNSVDNVRDLIASIGYHASSCRFKIYIIDEVHMLSTPAFNALLKTLEEPPPNVIFIFATTEPQKIPVTILSRCQRFDFHRLTVQEIAGKLGRIAEKDGVSIDEGSLLLIARRATGAMRDAESILEQIRASRGTDITVTDVNDVLGIADREVFFDIIDRCRERDTKAVLSMFIAYYDGGGDLREFVEGLLGHLRDMLYAGFEGGLDQVLLSGDLLDRLRDQASWYDRGDIVRMVQIVTDVESSLEYAVIPVLRIEVALARLSMLDRTVQLKSLFDRLGGADVSRDDAAGASSRTEPRPAADTRAASAEGMPPGRQNTSAAQDAEDDESGGNDGDEEDGSEGCLDIPLTAESIRENWDDIVERVARVKQMLHPSLIVGVPESFDDGRLVVGFDEDQSGHMKLVNQYLEPLNDVLGGILGVDVTLKTFSRRGNGEKKKTTELDDIVGREPIIGEILARFDGEITDDRRE